MIPSESGEEPKPFSGEKEIGFNGRVEFQSWLNVLPIAGNMDAGDDIRVR